MPQTPAKSNLAQMLVDGVVSYAMYVLDLEGIVKSWNPGAQRMKGYHPQEIIGSPFSVFSTAAAVRAGEPLRWLDIARATGEFQTEAWRVRKDGTRFWGSVAIDALRNAAGEVIAFATVSREIGPSAALRAGTEEHGGSAPLIVESVIDYALYLLDLDGTVKSWNPGAQRIEGYSAGEIIGSNFSLFFTEEDACTGEPARSLRIARESGRFEGKGWRVRKNGTRLWAGVVIDAVRDADGAVIGFAKVTRDITQSSALRQVSEDQGSIAQMLVDSVVDYAIYMLDLDGTVKSWNTGAQRIKGYTAEEIIGSHFSAFYPDDDIAAGEPARSLAIARETGRFATEGWRLRKDKTRLWASVVIDAVRNAEGAVVGFAKVTRDVTQSAGLRQVSEQLRTERRLLLAAKKSAEEAAARSIEKQQLMAMAERIAHLAYWQVDLARNEFVWSEELCRMAGLPKSDRCDLEDVFALYHPDDRLSVRGHLERASVDGVAFSYEARIANADRGYRHVHCHGQAERGGGGTIIGLFGVLQDITEAKDAERERVRVLEVATAVFDHAADGIMVTDAAGTILSVNPAFTEITGYTADEAMGQNPRFLQSGRQSPEFFRTLWNELTTCGRWQGEIWNQRKNGEVFIERQTITRVRNAEDETVCFVSVFSDTTEHWRKSERIRHLAFHDELTDLPNRAVFIDRLDDEIAIAEHEAHSLAVLFIDLDGFKAVNDRYGHDVGDALLRAIARRLQARTRRSDMVARLGGDEFVAMILNVGEDPVKRIAGNMIKAINEPLNVDGKSPSVGGSIGIAMYPANGRTGADLIRHADAAMYAAKGSGKNTYCFAQPVPDEST